MSKLKDKLENFILKVGNMKNKDKAYLKSVVTCIATVISFSISIASLVINDYKTAAIYFLCFSGMFLMFLSFSSQYRMFKFLAQFSGGINEKKD